MSNECQRGKPINFSATEIEKLKQDEQACNQGRRTFLKWSALLSTQAIAAGAFLDLTTGEARADDTFVNVTNWVYSVCGYCSVGCGLKIGVNAAGRAVAVKGNDLHPTNQGRVCVKGLYEYKVLDDQDLRVQERAKYPHAPQRFRRMGHHHLGCSHHPAEPEDHRWRQSVQDPTPSVSTTPASGPWRNTIPWASWARAPSAPAPWTPTPACAWRQRCTAT